MTIPTDEITDPIARLTEQYKLKLPKHIERLRFLWDGLRFINWSDKALESIIGECHKVSGTAGSFGFEEISEVAGALENIFIKSRNQTTTPNESDKSQINESIEKLEKLVSTNNMTQHFEPSSIPSSYNSGKGTRLFIIDDDEYYDELMKMKLEALGYEVHSYTSPKEAIDDIELYDPQLFILDLEFSNSDIDGIELIKTIRGQRGEQVPIILASRREDFRARLSAIRAGCQAYITKPVNLDDLTSTINVLVGKQTFSGCKVLVVDDDSDLTKLFEHYLSKIGVECMCINNPIHILRSVKSFDPHLVIVDVHMKNCTGLELAKVLRSENSLAGLGLIFMSGDKSVDWQQEALSLNTNGILLKPITESTLIKSVQTYLLNTQKQAQRLFEVTHINPETTLHNSGHFLHACREKMAKVNDTANQALFYISFSNYYEYLVSGTIVGARDAMIALGKNIRKTIGDHTLATQWGKNGFLVFLEANDESDNIKTASQIQEALLKASSSIAEELRGVNLHFGLASHISKSKLKDAIAVAQQTTKNAVKAKSKQIEIKAAISESEIKDDALRKSIQNAISQKNYVIVFQPIISMDSEEAVTPTYECFIRLKGDNEQIFMPNQFIEFISTERQKIDLNQRIIKNALETISQYTKQHGEPVTLHIKIPPEFVRHRDSLIWLANTFREYGLRDPSCLVFEFNEKDIAAYGSQGEFFANQFLRLGCGLIIEHFGATDTSEQMLQSYRPNMVKFDSELMNLFCADDLVRKKVMNLIELANYHRIKPIGYGVEDAMLVTNLWNAGIRLFQGYFFEEPMEIPNYNFEASVSFD